MGEIDELKYLEIFGVIAYDGKTLNGIKCHPDGVHIVYPVGNKICVRNMNDKKMIFFSGHTNVISTLNVSVDGKYIGSGQFNEVGLKATIILWDFDKRTIISTHDLHKVCVESVTFSCDGLYTISIGGVGCGQLVVWHNTLKAVCCKTDAANSSDGNTVIVASFNRRNNSFITGGNGNLRVWNINSVTKAPTFFDVAMGKLKRNVLSIAIDKNDQFAYCGTTSGDILKISIGIFSESNEAPLSLPTMKGCYAKCGTWKKNMPRPETIYYSSGVHCIIILEDESLIVGAGNGVVEIIKEIKWEKPLQKTKLYTPVSPNFKAIKTKKFKNSITSLQLMVDKNKKNPDKRIIIGKKSSEMFIMDMKTFQTTLVSTCHTSEVNDVAFPNNISDVFATASKGDIRIWCVKTCQELLRIQVAQLICSNVLFAADGKSIISAWSDFCIRAFKPLTGKLIFCILNTHVSGITALAITTDGKTIISGGGDGQVRVWDLQPQKQTLSAILKEHKGPVTAIKINNTDTEAVSAGNDGSCIIWDIINMCRRQVFFAHTLFTCVCYEPTCSQILTGGIDKSVSYWEAGSGTLIRELEASRSGSVMTVDIHFSGEYFVSGGDDQILKLWKYNEGIYTHLGIGHSGSILAAKFSPDGRYMVSCSASGSIFIWKFPREYLGNNIKELELKKTSASGIISTSSKSSASKRMLDNQHLKTINSSSSKSSSHKDENISTINTGRTGTIALCPCNESKSPK